MNKELSFNILIIFPLIQIAEEHGISKESLFISVGLQSEATLAADARLTIRQFVHILEIISARVTDINIGFKCGELMSTACTGILGYMMINCRTIGQAVEKYCTYQEVAGDAVTISVVTGKKSGKISWKNNAIELEPYIRPVLESLVSGTVTIGKEISGTVLPIREIKFHYPEPENVDEYNRFFDGNVSFNQPETSISFDMSYYNYPLHFSNPELLALFEKQAGVFLKRLSDKTTWVNKVAEILYQKGKLNYKTVDVAKELGMSIRSLQLKLKEESATFKELKDKVQSDIAKSFLENDNYSITETGYLLGFSEPSTFHRTFKRWTGMTPGEYRTSKG